MADTEELMLTTVDNPFNPFTHFDEWFAYDHKLGYNSCSLLARIVRSSDELSEADQQLAINNAIHEIVDINASGMHRKVRRTQSSTR
jgi:hypothetical protein